MNNIKLYRFLDLTYANYYVSETGELYSAKTRRFLKPYAPYKYRVSIPGLHPTIDIKQCGDALDLDHPYILNAEKNRVVKDETSQNL